MKNEKLARLQVKEKAIILSSPNLQHPNSDKVPALRFPGFEEEWEEKRLGEIAAFSKGKSISKIDISENGKYECIRYGELYTDYDEVIKEIKSKTNLPENELVFSEYNDVIIPASGESQIDIATASCVLKENVALGGDLNIIKTNENGVVLAYYLNSKKKLEIAALAQGNSVVHLYSKQLKTLSLTLPLLPEQQKIASFLSSVDERLQQLQQQQSLLEQYKKGCMQQLFSQKLRFKDDKGKAYPDWQEKHLHEVLVEHKTRNTGSKHKEVFSVAKNQGVINQIEHLGRSYSSADISNYKIVFPDDIVYTKSPTSDFPFGIIKQNKLKRTGVVSVLYAVYKPINKSIGALLDYYFSTWINVYNYLNPLVQRGPKNTMNIGNEDFLKGSKLSLPVSEEEQTKIVNFLSTIDEQINSVKQQISQTQQFKKGLLQQMFV